MNINRRSFITGLLIICFAAVGMLALSASASPGPRIEVEVEKDGTAYVVINGRKTIHLRTSNGTLSPMDRAKIVATRLTTLTEKRIDPKSIWYRQVGNNTHVMVGDTMLLIATVEEARVRKIPTVKLAEMWVQNLRKVLSLPPLGVSQESLLVPLGETRALTVESLLKSPVSVTAANPYVIALDGETKPGTLMVTGLSVGDTSIHLQCEEHTAQVQVSVKKYAAYPVPGSGKAIVTGWKSPPSLLARAIRDAARQAVSLEPGAKVQALNFDPIREGLEPGRSLRTGVQVEAAGGDHIPAKLNAQVEVENRILPRVPTSWIMYSNEPESVPRYQTLFIGRINTTQEAIRLLYHHQNRMNRRIGFVIDVVNPSDSPASLHVIEGVSPPMIDTVVVGYKAGIDFVENHRGGIGHVIEIPSGTRRVVVSQALDHPFTASGIMEFRQLSGKELLVRVTAKPEEQRLSEDPLDIILPAGGIDPSRLALSEHIYPGPIKDVEATYTAGRPWLFLRIGKHALKHATTEKLLYGNYGVTYDIKATLENPLSVPHEVEIVFEATAGPASAIFVVDGKVISHKIIRSHGEASLGKVTIPSGKNRLVSIMTIPLSGSAYPATLVIRPTRKPFAAADIR